MPPQPENRDNTLSVPVSCLSFSPLLKNNSYCGSATKSEWSSASITLYSFIFLAISFFCQYMPSTISPSIGNGIQGFHIRLFMRGATSRGFVAPNRKCKQTFCRSPFPPVAKPYPARLMFALNIVDASGCCMLVMLYCAKVHKNFNIIHPWLAFI